MRAIHVGPMSAHRGLWPASTHRLLHPTVTTVMAAVTAILTIGLLAVAVELDSLTRLVAGVLANDAAALGVGIVVGVALLAVATYLTIWWPALNASTRAALFLLSLLLWTLGMLLGDPRLTEHRVQAAQWLAHTSASSLTELAVIVMIVTFLTLSYLVRRPRCPCVDAMCTGCTIK